MPPFIYLPQYCILKSHKAAIFPLAAVALRFRHLRIFQNDEMEEKRREKEEKFSKSWPKRLTSNGVFSKRERESPFPAAKEDDALKLPWNQKERVLHIFDSYCKKILRQETWICSGQRCAIGCGSAVSRSCLRSFLRSFAARTFTPLNLKCVDTTSPSTMTALRRRWPSSCGRSTT